MFFEWVAAGAAFGVKAFFAIFVFAFICAAIVGMVALGTWAAGGKDKRRGRAD